ncbi:hypothetical protein DNTS_030172, partial [Danionella cerebrum]
DPCKQEDEILVRSDHSPTGRYSLENNGNSFTVTIADLRETDSGVYWCGVERFGVDTHIKVHLGVSEVSVYYVLSAGAGLVLVVITGVDVYENSADNKPCYASISKSGPKNKSATQTDPVYQNIHFNKSQGDDNYDDLY